MSADPDYVCEHCNERIDDLRAGNVYVLQSDLDAVRRARSGRPPSSGMFTSLADVVFPARWRVAHVDCEEGDTRYAIGLERVRSPIEALWWTVHLSSKPWVVNDTDWRGFLERVFLRDAQAP